MGIFDYGYGTINGKPTLSMSQINTYLACSHKAKLLYSNDPNQLKIKVPKHRSAASAGNIVHYIFEHHLESPEVWISSAWEILEKEEMLPGLTREQFFSYVGIIERMLEAKPYLKAPSYKNSFLQDKVKHVEKVSVLDKLDASAYLDAVSVSLIKGKQMDLFHKYGMCERERKFKYHKDEMPWVLTGTADLFLETEKAIFIGDYKSGFSGWATHKVKHARQFQHYAWLARKEFERPDDFPVIVTVIAPKTGEEFSAKLGEVEHRTHEQWLSAALGVVKAQQEDPEFVLVPTDTYAGCPCEVAAMGQCPYVPTT